MKNKSHLREYVIICLLGSAIGFISNSAFHVGPDLYWTALLVPYKFQLDGIKADVHERYAELERKRTDFFKLSEKASYLAILKACAEHGSTGAIIGGALGFAIAATRKRMRCTDVANNEF